EQWVGYWGYGNPTKLSQSLQLILQQTGENQNWYISAEIPENGILATLSASGLPFDFSNKSLLPDVWVKVAENSLILGREAFGRVPLYWLQLEQIIWFASRFQLLLPLIAAPKLNLAALYGYSCFSYVPTPLTPIENIFSLAPGTEQTWQIDLSKNSLFSVSNHQQSWQEKPVIINQEKEAINQLQTLLKTAIERQIVDLKDQTVGVFLSGGLDSSIVAALLVRAGVKVRAYSLDFGDEFAEYTYAEQVAQYLKIPLVKVDVTPKRIKAALIPTIQALDLPFGDGVTVPLFLLCQAASREVKIIFNGEGGDQLFAGWTNKPIIAASIYQEEHPDRQQSFEQKYLRTFHRLWGYESQIFQPTVYQEIQQINPENWLESALDSAQTNSLLHRLRRASLMLKGGQNIHPRATNLAFAQGLKVRSPFCDLDLAQWTFQVSEELFLQGACEKYILKRAAEDWLPSAIVWRQKRGMGVPLTPWFLENWWSELGNWLNPGILQSEGIWQPDLAARVALGELSGLIQGRRIGEVLWLLIVWQIWRSQLLKPPLKNYSFNHPFWLPYFLWRYKKQWS
ncbi:MAG: asparagine synthetase B family protein, partial [Microcystaceae cyanobacterium]